MRARDRIEAVNYGFIIFMVLAVLGAFVVEACS